RTAEEECETWSALAKELQTSLNDSVMAQGVLEAEVNRARQAEQESAIQARVLDERLARWEADLKVSRAEADCRTRDLETRNTALTDAVEALKQEAAQLRLERANERAATLVRKDQESTIHVDAALGEWE